mmetsp:Transcript_14416/g.36217  ORF Transcript_14416/g.36217 Transcript_14416/m.36217 type:complete len:281 (-) Transcript_14416:310-1152(-)
MTNTNNTYHDEETRFDDCVEGDTVSEGDTSDEEDIEASKTNTSPRRTSSQRKEGLELPSGSADGLCCSRTKKRKFLFVVLAVTALAATSAGIVGGIYLSKKRSASPLPLTTIDEEFASTSSIPESPSPDAIPSTEEDENETIQNSEVSSPSTTTEEEDSSSPSIPEPWGAIVSTVEDENDTIQNSEVEPSAPKNDHLGLLDEIMTGEVENEDNAQPTHFPALVGMTGEEAKSELEFLYGEEAFDIHILLEGTPVTRDYRFNRIRIFTDSEGVVTKAPHVG